MAYAAQSDLLLRMTVAELTQLTDDERTGQVNAAIVAKALSEASGIVEGFCRSRYQVPLQPSEELVRICRDIAVYQIWSRRPQKIKEGIRETYDDAMALLRQISRGEVQLDQPANAPAGQTPAGTAVKPLRQDLRFTEHNLDGFI